MQNLSNKQIFKKRKGQKSSGTTLAQSDTLAWT